MQRVASDGIFFSIVEVELAMINDVLQRKKPLTNSFKKQLITNLDQWKNTRINFENL